MCIDTNRRLFKAAPNPRQGLLASAALFFLLLVTFPCSGHAQTTSGITGTVTDPTGAVVSGAAVTITNNATGTVTRTVTSSAGQYSEEGLLPGRYTIVVTAPGFTKTVQNQVNVEVTVRSTIDIALQAGSGDQTVEVTADLIALNTTQPELGTTIENKVVQSLPVAIGGGRGRQVDNLQFLAPGVTGNTFAHNVNGGVNFEQEVLYNGVPVPQSETAGNTGNFNPPFELVNEFRVERSTFSAQYGLAQGAVTYQMASGTNRYHGDVFYINRNEAYDARGYYNDTVPPDKENDFGFAIGGPVVIPHLYNGHDRTFFNFVLDFAKSNIANTGIGTVPTVLEKGGDFSDFLDGNGKLIPIFDPLTHQQFVYQGRLNVIDPARFSAISKSILQYIPNPDRPGLTGNKTSAAGPIALQNHALGFTVDHNLTSKQSFHYSQWRNPYQSSGYDYSPIVPSSNPLQSEKYNPALGTVYILNYTNTISSKLVATAGFLWLGEINNEYNNYTGANFAAVQNTPLSNIFPNVTFNGNNAPTNFGTNGGWVQSVNRKLGISIVNNYLWTKGRNTFNIGGELRRTYQDDNECQTCGGQFNYSQHTTADPNNLQTTGSSFASFLLGQVDNANRSFSSELRLRNLSLSPYIQDDIKITPKLTLNVGLRWDILRPFTENNNQIVYLNGSAPNPAANGLAGIATQFGNCSLCSGITRANIGWKKVGPRFGAAYMINDRTVLQGGFSLSYLDGGAYEYGTSKVAVNYGNLLQGSFTRNSTNGVNPGYGSWDTQVLPAPSATPLSPTLGFGNTIRAFDPQHDNIAPYNQQWNLQLQRQIPFNLFLNVAYIGNRTVHLPSQLNPIEQPNPSILRYGPLLGDLITDPAVVAAGFHAPYANFVHDFGNSATLAHALEPFPQYANVYNNFELEGAANYEGLQTSLEKRFSNGLAFLTSYTLSRSMSNVDSGFSTFASTAENKYNQYPEWTIGGSDIKNLAKVSGTYELPIGPGKAFLHNKGVTGEVLGGFQVSWILSYQGGTPFGISENGNPLGNPGGFNRPNRNPAVPLSVHYQHPIGRTRVTQSVIPAGAFIPTGTYELGNALRNYPQLRNPAYYDEDINIRKTFALKERFAFFIQADFFNVFNRTIFNGPETNLSSGNFGTPGVGQSNTQRTGQITGKITF